MQERDELLRTINMYDFLVEEAVLYLDTHKTCPHGLAFFRKYRDMRENAVKEYVAKYGPLVAEQAKAEGYWDWTDAPWPWEKGE